jgi:hypothetical protein
MAVGEADDRDLNSAAIHRKLDDVMRELHGLQQKQGCLFFVAAGLLVALIGMAILVIYRTKAPESLIPFLGSSAFYAKCHGFDGEIRTGNGAIVEDQLNFVMHFFAEESKGSFLVTKFDNPSISCQLRFGNGHDFNVSVASIDPVLIGSSGAVGNAPDGRLELRIGGGSSVVNSQCKWSESRDWVHCKAPSPILRQQTSLRVARPRSWWNVGMITALRIGSDGSAQESHCSPIGRAPNGRVWTDCRGEDGWSGTVYIDRSGRAVGNHLGGHWFHWPMALTRLHAGSAALEAGLANISRTLSTYFRAGPCSNITNWTHLGNCFESYNDMILQVIALSGRNPTAVLMLFPGLWEW